MTTKNNITKSMICIVLIFLITMPIYPERKGASVNVELINNKSYDGELFEVLQDEIYIYSNQNINKIKTSEIKSIRILHKSVVGKSMLIGAGIGFSLGGIIALSTKVDNEGIIATEEGQFLISAGALAIEGLVCGALFGLLNGRNILYKFAKYSESKKIRTLKKLRKKARL